MLANSLDDVVSFLTRFVRFPDPKHQPVAVALWVAHTYAIDAAEYTPYMQITGPEKRCGKSRLLEVLDSLVKGPIYTSSISPAALFRVIEEAGPTILFDEYDNILGRHASDNAGDLRAILNAGHRRSAKVHRTVRVGGNFKLQTFDVFGAKALAGIGDLPDTLADRCIRIQLQRQPPHDQAEKFRRDQRHNAEPIAARLAQWMESLTEELQKSRPHVPETLNDRLSDGWEPLIAIAECAGADWPANARAAAVALAGTDDNTMSTGQQLLIDIQTVFDQASGDLISTTDGAATWSMDLTENLHRLEESPWSDWDLKPRRLARILKGFGITPHDIRKGDVVRRGYRFRDFQEAFARYIPLHPSQSATSTTSTTSPDSLTPPGTTNERVADVVDVANHNGRG